MQAFGRKLRQPSNWCWKGVSGMENGYRVRRERNSKKIFKTVLVEIFLQSHRFCCSMYFLCLTLCEKTANCFLFWEYHQSEICTEFLCWIHFVVGWVVVKAKCTVVLCIAESICKRAGAETGCFPLWKNGRWLWCISRQICLHCYFLGMLVMWGVAASSPVFWSDGKSWVHTRQYHLHNIDAHVWGSWASWQGYGSFGTYACLKKEQQHNSAIEAHCWAHFVPF